MGKLTRRDLIKLGIGSAFALNTPNFLIACSNEDEQDKELSSGESLPVVAAIRGDDLYAMTRDAIDALGGIQKIVHDGETVFLKPNMMGLPFAETYNPFSAGDCTKPEILIAVAEECLRAGAKEVLIGDASHMSRFSWELAQTLDGETNLQVEAERLSEEYSGKVTLACLDSDSPEMVNIPSNTYLKEISISSLVANADRIISIPVMKTHTIAQLTLSLKNFIGVAALTKYATVSGGTSFEGDFLQRLETFDHSSPESIAEIYLDIVDVLKPDLAIIDCSIGVEGDGPSSLGPGGGTVDMKKRIGSWVLLASSDLVAADAAAAHIMNHSIKDIKQLVMANERGLGEIDRMLFDVVGEKLDDLQVDCKQANLVSYPMPETKEES